MMMFGEVGRGMCKLNSYEARVGVVMFCLKREREEIKMAVGAL